MLFFVVLAACTARQELAEKEAFAWEGYAGAVGDDHEAAAKALSKAEGLLVRALSIRSFFGCTTVDKSYVRGWEVLLVQQIRVMASKRQCQVWCFTRDRYRFRTFPVPTSHPRGPDSPPATLMFAITSYCSFEECGLRCHFTSSSTWLLLSSILGSTCLMLSSSLFVE